MKKIIALFLSIILIFSLFACNFPTSQKYKLTVYDFWGYLVEPLDEYYEAGEEVKVTLAFLSGPSVGIKLNGEYIGENTDTEYDGACPIITFTMPAKDSVLYTTQNGHIGFGPTPRDDGLNANQLSVPDDFSFALTWNVFGVSSYDSQTGKLVKTTDATNPDDYVTYYELTDLDKEYIYSMIVALDVNSYPDVYDPQNGCSKPSATLILTVRLNGTAKTVESKNISLSFFSDDERGQLFLDTCEAISNVLESTDEWKALPEYEVLYE